MKGLRGNNEYDSLIKQRYKILENLESKEPLTNKTKLDLQKNLENINTRISQINNQESDFNKILINLARLTGFYQKARFVE